MPSLCWIHSLWAGLDALWCPDILDNPRIHVTNAKGVFSSSLAEYVIGACLWSAKDIPRLMSQRENREWNQYPVLELRGATMGIIGYGDIGRACAKLAKAFGMKVISYRRRPNLSATDELVDVSYGPGELSQLMAESDYAVLCAPLTDETRHMIGGPELACAKQGQFLVNIGRGALIDESALISALKDKTRIRGAALDVFSIEPLPSDSEIWSLPNVLLSPHNADYTADSVQLSARRFVGLCNDVLSGQPVTVVDKTAKY